MKNIPFSGNKNFDNIHAKEIMKYIEETLSNMGYTVLSIDVADLQLDCKKSTDFVAHTTGGDLRIASRIRRDDCKFRDMTIRVEYFGSNNTEINKIHNADYYIYSWCQNNKINEYAFINISKVCKSGILKWDWKQYSNKNDPNKFIAIPLKVIKDKKAMIVHKRKKRAK